MFWLIPTRLMFLSKLQPIPHFHLFTYWGPHLWLMITDDNHTHTYLYGVRCVFEHLRCDSLAFCHQGEGELWRDGRLFCWVSIKQEPTRYVVYSHWAAVLSGVHMGFVWKWESVNVWANQQWSWNIMHTVEGWRREFGQKARKISEINADRARRHLHQPFTHLDKSSGKNKLKRAGWNQIQTFLSVLLQILLVLAKLSYLNKYNNCKCLKGCEETPRGAINQMP